MLSVNHRNKNEKKSKRRMIKKNWKKNFPLETTSKARIMSKFLYFIEVNL